MPVVIEYSGSHARKTGLPVILACWLYVLLPQKGFSFIDPPQLDPDIAITGQAVNLLLRTGVCNWIIVDPDNPEITADGDNIAILIDGIRAAFCVFPIVEHTFPIGAYNPGEYTTKIRFRYESEFLPGEIIIEDLGELTLLVQAGAAPPPLSVSSGHWMTSILLISTILLIGGISMRTITAKMLTKEPIASACIRRRD